MAIPKRRTQEAGTYFVTSRTWQSRSIFLKEDACQIFIEALFHYRNGGAYRVHAFVLMSDHFHLLMTPVENTSLERAVQFVKGGSAHKIRKDLRFQFPVWQRGFSDHRIRDTQDYNDHVRYIEENPLKRRMVASANEYPWSSAFGNYKLDLPPQGLKPRIDGDRLSGTAEAVP